MGAKGRQGRAGQGRAAGQQGSRAGQQGTAAGRRRAACWMSCWSPSNFLAAWPVAGRSLAVALGSGLRTLGSGLWALGSGLCALRFALADDSKPYAVNGRAALRTLVAGGARRRALTFCRTKEISHEHAGILAHRPG